MTLVEVLIALLLMVLVTLATLAMHSVSNQSYRTVDASQELNDSARYALEVIGQSVRIAGYQEYMNKSPQAKRAGDFYPAPCTSTTPPCPILGFDNSSMPSPSSEEYGKNDSTAARAINASDVLALTYSGASAGANPDRASGSVVDCQGVAQPVATGPGNLGLSLFGVTLHDDEPGLACMSRGTGNAQNTRNTQPIVQGVETFQVMYGVDINEDAIPDQWVSARSVTNWMQVRAVRVGLVLRGPPGSSQGTAIGADSNNILYPLGKDFTGSSSEQGLQFMPPADGRLRQAYSATFMLRNAF